MHAGTVPRRQAGAGVQLGELLRLLMGWLRQVAFELYQQKSNATLKGMLQPSTETPLVDLMWPKLERKEVQSWLLIERFAERKSSARLVRNVLSKWLRWRFEPLNLVDARPCVVVEKQRSVRSRSFWRSGIRSSNDASLY